jgi:hypothetical protein
MVTPNPRSARTRCSLVLVLLTVAASLSAQSSPPITVITELSGLVFNAPVTIQLQARGGVGPYTWEMLGSTWPQYLTLSRDGILSGSTVPEGTGNDFWYFSVRVTDANGATATREYTSVSIGWAGSTPAIINRGLRIATRDAAYSESLQAQFGEAPYTFSISSGSLPPGIDLSGDRITGTPTAAGTYVFGITVTDNRARTRAAIYSIRVAAPNDLSVVPDELVAGLDDPIALTMDDDFVYWTEWASRLVRRVPKAGGPATTLYTSSQPVRALLVDQTNLYFTDGDLKRLPKSGGTATTLATNEHASGLATDGAFLYWTNDVVGAVKRVALSGGTATTLATRVRRDSELALDGGYLFWNDGLNFVRIPAAGGTVLDNASLIETSRFAVRGGHVFFPSYRGYPNTGEVVDFSWVTGSSTYRVLDWQLDAPNDLAMSGEWLFWTEDHPQGTVRQLSITGGAALTLATNVANPTALGADDTHVYWLTRNAGIANGGSLWRVPIAIPDVDVARPRIQITSPSDLFFSTSSATISLAGIASDNVGVTEIQWSDNHGGSGVATGTTNWSTGPLTLTPGHNQINMRASDDAGWVSYDSVYVTYYPPVTDTFGPYLTVTPPSGPWPYATTQPVVTLTGTASDASGVAQVTWATDRGASGVTTGTTAWSAAVALQPGANAITVTARDGVGNTSTWTLSITYNPAVTTPPASPTPVSPTGTTDGQSPTFVWNASYGASHYDLWVNDPTQNGRISRRYTPAAAGCASGFGTCTASPGVRLALGQSTWWILAENAYGASAWSQATFTVLSDATPPVVDITSPSSWSPAFALVDWYRIKGTASDNGTLAQVTWVNNRGGSGTATGTSNWIADVFLYPGENVITVTARDTANHTASDSVTITFSPSNNSWQLLLATPTPVAPLGGTTTTKPTFTWTAVPYASEYRVEVRDAAYDYNYSQTVSADDAGCSEGTGTCSLYWTWWTLAPGRAVWWVKAESAGVASSDYSAGHVFTVTTGGDTVPPSLKFTTPSLWFATTNSTPFRIAGTASDNAGVVQVTWRNARFASGTASGTTNWTADVPLYQGDNYIEVMARDAAGNLYRDDVIITLTGSGPPASVQRLEPWIDARSVMPTFRWTGRPEATHYDLRASDSVQDDRIFISITATDAHCSGGGECAVHLGAPLAPGLARWTVRAVNDAGPGAWTPWESFGVHDVIESEPPDVRVDSPWQTASVTGFESLRLGFSSRGPWAGSVIADVTWTNNRGGEGRTSSAYDSVSVRLQPGDNFITVTARDAANQTSTATLTVTYTPEAGSLLAPSPISPASAAVVQTTTPAFRWAAVNGATQYELRADGADQPGRIERQVLPEYSCTGGICTYTETLTALARGNATWWVRALGAGGAKSAWSAATEFVVIDDGRPDITPPTITVLQPTTATTFSSSRDTLTLVGSAQDNLGVRGVAFVSWANDRGGAGFASGTTTWSASISLQPGVNVITVTTRDAARNTASDTLTVTYIPVTGPPAAPVPIWPNGDTNSRNPSFTWTASFGATHYDLSVDDASQSAPFTQRLSAAAAGCAAGEHACAASPGWGLALGAATWRVLATNEFGNGPSSADTPFTVTNGIDVTSPSVSIVVPVAGATYTTSQPTVALGGTASDNIDVTEVTWSNDRGGSGAATGTATWSSTIGLRPGANVIRVTAHDASGNTADDIITVTYNPPIPPVPTLVSPSGAITARTPTFTWSAAIGATKYELWVNDAAQNGRISMALTPAEAGCDAGNATCAINPGITLAMGNATWWVLASNAAGNNGWSAPMTFSVTSALDTTAPALSITTPTAGTVYITTTASLTVGGTASDNVGVTQVTWSNDRGGSGIASGSTAWSATVTLQPGANVITATARDAANNVASDTLTITYNPPAGPPAVPTLLSPSGTASTRTPTFTWTATSGATKYELWVNDAAQSGRISLAFTPADAGCDAGNATCSVSPGIALASGSATWWVLASNTAGNNGWSAPMTITVP